MSDFKSKILIIDDDQEYTDLVKKWFGSEYDITVFNDSTKALRHLEEQKPHLILLDLKMPEISGHDICGILNNHQAFSEIPILYISAIDNEQEHKKALDLGAKDYLLKKIDKLTLQNKINQYLQKTKK